MKITLLVVGRTATGYLARGIDEYVSRLSHYVKFDIQYVGDVRNTRNLTQAQQKTAEGAAILQRWTAATMWCYSMNAGPSGRRSSWRSGCNNA